MITTAQGIPLEVVQVFADPEGKLIMVDAERPDGDRRVYYPYQLRGDLDRIPTRRKTDHQ